MKISVLKPLRTSAGKKICLTLPQLFLLFNHGDLFGLTHLQHPADLPFQGDVFWVKLAQRIEPKWLSTHVTTLIAGSPLLFHLQHLFSSGAASSAYLRAKEQALSCLDLLPLFNQLIGSTMFSFTLLPHPQTQKPIPSTWSSSTISSFHFCYTDFLH